MKMGWENVNWNVFAHYKVQLRFYGDCGKHMVVPLPTGNFLNQ